MNIRQKMIEAMRENCLRDDVDHHYILDAALAVLADPANWTVGMNAAMERAFVSSDSDEITFIQIHSAEFSAVINYVRGRP